LSRDCDFFHGMAEAGAKPLELLREWIDEAREAGLAQPGSVAFVTVGADGRPSARTVNLKRLEDDELLFSSALWTRKAREIEANPNVALLFHWPSLGRQAHVMGRAAVTDRRLSEELFAERDLFHQLQSVVSRQGEPTEDLAEIRGRLTHLAQVQETAPACPPDWGGLRVVPEIVELWSEAEDRIHERRLFAREGEGWSLTLLSP
jgi:pyridoxamine 5'-phosphate oxidase